MERPWLNHYPAGIRANLEYPEVPAYHFLFEQIQKHPGRTALIFFGKKITYGQLGAQIDSFAAALRRRLEIQPGDRVGIILPNCPQNVIATVAVQRAGGVPVQFNPMYVAREIAYQVRDSGVRVMITLDLLWGKVREAGGADRYIQTSIADFLPFPLNLLFPLKFKAPKIAESEALHFRDLLKESAAGFQPATFNVKEDAAVLLYTGGTTGVSKGVHLTHANITANIVQIREWLQRPEDQPDVVMGALPMFHSFGFTATLGFALASGGTVVLVLKPEPAELLKLVHKYRPTSFPGVPTLYTSLLQHPDVSKYNLKVDFCVSGAAPMPVELMQKFETLTGSTIIEGFGLTETSPVTHTNPMRGTRKPGSVGLPLPDTDVRIVDLETGEDVPNGQAGEVLLRGPQVMKGYWNKPAETSEVLKDGWLYTGDIGRMDDEGYLFIVDRKKDMIIAGGFNIYPREIDEILYQHPAVLEACTVGVPDEYRGETVKAFAVLKPGAVATEQELMDFCKEKLANYKRPRQIEFVEALPKSAVGKILRRELAAREREKLQGAVSASQ